ncbi:hypothetical protein [Flammeovirga agarivorans]|uniref:Uncharacterized protein n=1 Tax=Flammeovirga agarivorans TaxID=2726742 RepID=A0A7X8SRI3_9BACT|nr:hypothetical protein [Flammeovirga agarivorans]NLR95085.1 hypothetical protein [Flammeovirga agarivorans]
MTFIWLCNQTQIKQTVTIKRFATTANLQPPGDAPDCRSLAFTLSTTKLTMTKKHNYLNLKIGEVEQYSMVVKKKDIAKWKFEGWLEFTEVGLPKGDEDAFMLYGEIEKDEMLIFNSPKLLHQLDKNKILGLTVVDYNPYLGTYGMGGAGFFGFLLSNNEYLTYSVWNAGDYIIVDDRVVECDEELYGKTKPWISNQGEDKTWDDLSNYITGSIITNYIIEDDNCRLELEKHGKIINISFVKNDIKLPRKVGRKRNAYKKGNIKDYIIFQHKEGTLIV